MSQQFVDEKEKSGSVSLLERVRGLLIEREKEIIELKAEKHKTAEIIKNFTDGLLFFDKNLNLVLVNSKIEGYFNVISQEILHKSFIELIDSSLFQSFKPLLTKGNKNIKTVFREEIQIEQNLILEITTIDLGKKNNQIGKLIICHDITREKEVDKIKSNFIAVAAHQLRTPLSIVKWTFKMLLNGDAGKISAEQQDLVKKGYESNERMISLINSLLDISRVEEGKFGYTFKKTNIIDLIQKSINFFLPITKEKYINLILKNNLKRIVWLEADQEKLFLVFQNLIDNAIKYSSVGGEIIVNINKNDNKLLVKIIDRGIGIPKEEQNKLFVKFSRGSNAKRVFTDGSGLGLFIAKNIVEKHQGKIWFESEENKGTTLYVELPLIDNK